MKNRTGELREEMEQILGILYNFHLDGDAYADQVLRACKDKGMAFVVDRELPTNPDIPEEFNELACGPEDDTDNCSRAGYLMAQQDMLSAGYKPFEEIDIEENTD